MPWTLSATWSGAEQRARRARGDRDVGPAEQRQDAQRVACRRRQAAFPATVVTAQQVQLGSSQRDDEREGIVVARVTVEDERDPIRHRRSMPKTSAMRYDAPSVPTREMRSARIPGRQDASRLDRRRQGLEEDTCRSASV